MKHYLVGLRVNLMDCKDPNKLWDEIKKRRHIRKWIPVTVAEQIWMIFVFDKQKYVYEYLEWIKTCDVFCKTIYNKNSYLKDMLMDDETLYFAYKNYILYEQA